MENVPDSMEQRAEILQGKLRYSYLIALVEDAYGMSQSGYGMEGLDDDIRELHGWIVKNL